MLPTLACLLCLSKFSCQCLISLNLGNNLELFVLILLVGVNYCTAGKFGEQFGRELVIPDTCILWFTEKYRALPMPLMFESRVCRWQGMLLVQFAL